MSPKDQKIIKAANKLPNKDIHLRISYLLQVSQHQINSEALQVLYNSTSLAIAQKAQVKISPLVKRGICKKCKRSMNQVRTRMDGKNEIMVVRCKCSWERRFVGDKELFSQVNGEISEI